MSIRGTIANGLLAFAISMGELLGLRRTVELSDHSIDITLEKPSTSDRAWDKNLYKKGNVFVKGYANPIKPRVHVNPQLENPDTVEIEEGNGQEEETDSQVELIASNRYQSFMRQDLISQLLNPESQWRILVYGVIGLGILQFIGIIVTLYGTGAF